MAEHTPGPWTLRVTDDHDPSMAITEIVGADGELIADDVDYYPEPVRPANAAHIVECVNAMEPDGKVERLLRSLGHIAYALEQDGRTADGTTKAGAAASIRAALEPFNPEGA